MTRYLIDVYKVEIPENGKRCDDLTEATEDWINKLTKDNCFQFQLQGNTKLEVAEKLGISTELATLRATNAEQAKRIGELEKQRDGWKAECEDQVRRKRETRKSLTTQLHEANAALEATAEILREARDGEIEVSTLREAIESALRASGVAQ